MRALLEQPSRRYPTGIRNRALIRLMYRTGLRSAEALALRPRQVQLARSEIRVVKGKRQKDRVLWVDPATREMLAQWNDKRPKSDWFFCTLDGGELRSSYLREMLGRYGLKAGIETRVHPHLLRHTFASEYLEDGGTLPELQQLMGHVRLETTEIYTHVADERLRSFLMERPG